MKTKRMLAGIVVVFLVMLVCQECLASYSFFYHAYKTAPEMAGQRAIVVYKDGMEKLIIESALD